MILSNFKITFRINYMVQFFCVFHTYLLFFIIVNYYHSITIINYFEFADFSEIIYLTICIILLHWKGLVLLSICCFRTEINI